MKKSTVEVGGRKRFGNKTFRNKPVNEDKDRFLKIVGVILVSTMTISIICSIWFGWKIRNGLSDLNQEKVVSSELEGKALMLETRRTQLMAKDMIEKKASVLGLRKPDQKQIVRP